MRYIMALLLLLFAYKATAGDAENYAAHRLPLGTPRSAVHLHFDYDFSQPLADGTLADWAVADGKDTYLWLVFVDGKLFSNNLIQSDLEMTDQWNRMINAKPFGTPMAECVHPSWKLMGESATVKEFQCDGEHTILTVVFVNGKLATKSLIDKN